MTRATAFASARSRAGRLAARASVVAALLFGLAIAPGCSPDSDGLSEYPRVLEFSVIEGGGEGRLWVDWDLDRMNVAGPEGTERQTALRGELRAELLALFEASRRRTYASDYDDNALPLADRPKATDCDGESASAACQAIELAAERVAVAFVHPTDPNVPPLVLSYEGPTVLSDETAEMLLRLHEVYALLLELEAGGDAGDVPSL